MNFHADFADLADFLFRCYYVVHECTIDQRNLSNQRGKEKLSGDILTQISQISQISILILLCSASCTIDLRNLSNQRGKKYSAWIFSRRFRRSRRFLFRYYYENEISYKIRGAVFDVYNALGPGLLESIYQEALAYQLRKDGLDVKEQVPVPVYYDGQRLSNDLRLDMLVEDKVVVELKSVTELKPVHYKQLKSYIVLAHKKLGLLVSFTTDNIASDIKRVANGL